MAAQPMLITWENWETNPMGEWPPRHNKHSHQTLDFPQPALEPHPRPTINTTV